MSNHRLIEQLEEEARVTLDPVVWVRAVCRIALLLARHGELPASHERIAQVRRVLGPELHPEVASWVMLAEGVQHYFEIETKKAHDRLTRAYLLAIALRTESARPACAAWMALIEFHRAEYPAMVSHLREALRDARADDHHARGRAALVLADAFQVAGSYDLARPWYERARRHAMDEGDPATLGAILRNVSTLRTANLRLAHAFDRVSDGELLRASMELDSAKTYDFAIGSKALLAYVPLIAGYLRAIEGRHDAALTEFAEARAVRGKALDLSDQVGLEADEAWCLAMVGREAEARAAVEKLEAAVAQLSEHDDVAVVQARLAATHDKLGHAGAAARAREAATSALARHRTMQLELLKLLPEALPQAGAA